MIKTIIYDKFQCIADECPMTCCKGWAILAGGSDEPNDYKKGFDLVEDLKQKMNENRIKRLVSIGIDEDLANDISKAHTPNFM